MKRYWPDTLLKPRPRKPIQTYSYRPVPKLWPNATVVCIGAGPSCTKADCEYVRGKARVIAINTMIEWAPWADALYACDHQWWKWAHQLPKQFPHFQHYRGLKFALTRESGKWPGVHVLQNTGSAGLEMKPNGLRNGRNGGYQAINLAVHLGAIRILLLGYDMARRSGKEHCHGDHPRATHSPYVSFRQSYQTIVQPLKDLGITVINCTRETELTCFTHMRLEEALPSAQQAVA